MGKREGVVVAALAAAIFLAVGNPAKIIKRYCLQTKQWKKTSPEGEFID